MHGLLDVRFEREGKKTIAREIRQSAPLKVLRSLFPEGESPSHLYILNVTGGILEGDHIAISFHLRPDSEVVVTTPAATKVHPMPLGDAKQTISLYLDRGAVLEYISEPLLPFSGAAFDQNVSVFLENGARFLWIDILAPGRMAQGEVFAYRRYGNRMSVSDSEGLISLESFRLMPHECPMNLLGVMEDYSHLGSLYLFCDETLLLGLLKRIRSIETEGLTWGATLLSRRGIFVRALAFETPVLQAFFISIWALFRREVLGRALPPSRRY